MRKKEIFYSVLIILLSALVFTGCKKKNDIGQELIELPGDKLGVGFSDSTTILTYSLPVDSFPTDEIKSFMLGSYYDDVFGVTSTSFSTQIRLSSNDLDFGLNAICDSVVLTLDYEYLYGDDTLSPQNIIVYELDEDIYFDSTYYSNDQFMVKSPEIGNVFVKFNTNDSVYEGETKIGPHIRIKLDNAFGEKIMSKSGLPELADNDNFLQFIKGLHIMTMKNSTGGAIAGIDLLSSVSRMAIYYHNDEDTIVSSFSINENSARVQSFDHHDYQDASIAFMNQVINKDTNLGKQNVYLQPMAGVKTFLRFPHLKEYVKEKDIALNKAELVLNVDQLFADYEGAPPTIILVKQEADSTLHFPKDYSETSSFYGGIYDEVNKMYYFTITRHLQSVLSGYEEDYGMFLMISGSGISPKRVVLNGPEASNKMRLRLFYTVVD